MTICRECREYCDLETGESDNLVSDCCGSDFIDTQNDPCAYGELMSEPSHPWHDHEDR